MPVEGGVWDLIAADLDGDGAQEILVATEGGTVTAFSVAGAVRGDWYAPSRVVEMQVAALQPGGAPQIVLREGRFIHALNPVVNGIPSPIPTRGPPTLDAWDGTVPAKDGTVLLAVAGDVMLARTVEEYAGKYGVDYPFAPAASALSQADIAVGNLECAIALGGEPAAKTYVFRAHPDMAAGLGRSGLNAMSLANNHILDFGDSGFAETLQHLESQGIAALGAGMDRAEAERPLIYDIRGVKVAVVAWLAYLQSNFAAGDNRPGVAYMDDRARMAAQIREAKKQADVVVIILHGGKEYSFTSNAQQQDAAHWAIDAGADLVVGHHPHVLQETEIYGGRLIVYSLGDFVFDIDNYDAARDGAVLWAWIGKDGVRWVEQWRTRIVHDAQVRFLVGPDGQPSREVLLPGD
jgi:poly-gamma-glutamate synthesis protein (capsule biosynthesis protein)